MNKDYLYFLEEQVRLYNRKVLDCIKKECDLKWLEFAVIDKRNNTVVYLSVEERLTEAITVLFGGSIESIKQTQQKLFQRR